MSKPSVAEVWNDAVLSLATTSRFGGDWQSPSTKGIKGEEDNIGNPIAVEARDVNWEEV